MQHPLTSTQIENQPAQMILPDAEPQAEDPANIPPVPPVESQNTPINLTLDTTQINTTNNTLDENVLLVYQQNSNASLFPIQSISHMDHVNHK